jgi:outer membrane protein assembly factor BamE (lipoprotein component of BamABCDE complex)
MKRASIVSSALIVFLAAAYAVGVSLRCSHCHSVSDRFFYAMFAMDDATQFSTGYSETNFQRISKGMSKAEVLSLVGEPLKKHVTHGKEFSEVWRFSQGPPDRNYWFRIVLFDADERVVAREAKYFVD